MLTLQFLQAFLTTVLADSNNGQYGVLITILVILAIVALVLYLVRGRR